MTTHLILVSHALTGAIRTASFPGDERLDPLAPDLSELRAKIKAMGSLNQALTGPEWRTAETAAALRLDDSFSADAELRDCHYGRWTGRTLTEIQAEEPDAIGAWITDPEANPHGGESLLAILKRTAAWMDEQSKTGGRILAVSHPTVIRAAILHAIGAPPSSFWRINVEPLSLTDLRANGGRWTLRAIG